MTASQQVSVGTTATRVDVTDPWYANSALGSVLVRNRGSVSVFLGGSAVTTANGFELGAGESVSMDLGTKDTLYGIVASGTARVDVVQIGGR